MTPGSEEATSSARSWAKRVPAYFWFTLVLFLATQALQVWSSPPGGVVRFELAFGRDAALEILEGWGEAGRRQAARNIRLDFPFIVGYGMLSLSVVAWAMRRNGRWLFKYAPLLVMAVIVAGFLDVVENLLLLRILDDPDTFSAGQILAAGLAASIKFVLLALAVATLVIWRWRARK